MPRFAGSMPRSRMVPQPDPRSTEVNRGRSPSLVVLKVVLISGGLFLLMRWALQRLPGDTLVLDPWSVTGAVALNQLALFAAAWRLQATLKAFGVRIGRGQAIRIHLQSLFYFFFVPMSVGLEIARFLKIRALDPDVSVKRLFLALLLDRVLGLLAAVIVAGALLPAVMPQLLPKIWHPGWGAALAVLLLGVSLAVSLHQPFRRQIARAATAVAVAVGCLHVLISLSLAALLLVCASVYLVAVGAHIDIGLAALTFALSTALLGMTLPVSMLGITLGEAGGTGILVFLGLNTASALLLVSVAFTGRLLGALQGGIIELWVDGRQLAFRRKFADASSKTAASG